MTACRIEVERLIARRAGGVARVQLQHFVCRRTHTHARKGTHIAPQSQCDVANDNKTTAAAGVLNVIVAGRALRHEPVASVSMQLFPWLCSSEICPALFIAHSCLPLYWFDPQVCISRACGNAFVLVVFSSYVCVQGLSWQMIVFLKQKTAPKEAFPHRRVGVRL